ncbi:MAG: hypothetical protein LBQ34_04385 [Alphaproteobacteria bacterium]|jgi:hypothetical protein|nr:hypothetical protein [Alphaproteobacteria bacterium]
MKKIICVNNQQDLITALCEESHDKIINQKENHQESCKKNNQKSCEKNLIVIDSLLIDNLGMVLLRHTIDYYNKNQHFTLLNVGDSLPFLIFALENHFKLILTSPKNHDISNFKELAENQDAKIFSFTENIFECLITN